MSEIVAFDLDGTLGYWEPGRKPSYDDPEACAWYFREYRDAPPLVAALARQGVEIHVVTGRSEAVSVPTMRFIEDHYPWIPTDNLHMQPEWRGWDALRRFKTECLAALGQGRYVGDHDVDRESALAAGWSFGDAEQWRQSNPFTYSTPPLGVM